MGWFEATRQLIVISPYNVCPLFFELTLPWSPWSPWSPFPHGPIFPKVDEEDEDDEVDDVEDSEAEEEPLKHSAMEHVSSQKGGGTLRFCGSQGLNFDPDLLDLVSCFCSDLPFWRLETDGRCCTRRPLLRPP